MTSSQAHKYNTTTRKILKLRSNADMVARPFNLTRKTVTYALDPQEPLITFTLPPITTAGAGRAHPSAKVPAPLQRKLYQCWGLQTTQPEEVVFIPAAKVPPRAS